MLRRLFTILSAISLLVCGATIIMHLGPSPAIYGPRLWFKHNWAYIIGTGQVDKDPDWDAGRNPVGGQFANGGSWVIWNEPGESRRRASIRVPDDLVVLVTAILPTIWIVSKLIRIQIIRHRLTARARSGQCLTCGYDLRATPGRCPECGTETAPSRAPE